MNERKPLDAGRNDGGVGGPIGGDGLTISGGEGEEERGVDAAVIRAAGASAVAGWASPDSVLPALRGVAGRGLHSSTFRRNVSIFCDIRWLHDFPRVY